MRATAAAVLSGLTLAVVASASGSAFTPALWSVRGDGSARELVAVLPGDGRVLDRTEAGRLAVETDEGLVLEDADGGHRVLLPDTAGVDVASFSPDGTSLLFRAGGAVEEAASDGSSARVVARDAVGGAWSPDGRAIAYVALTAVQGRVGALRTVPAAGGAPRTVAGSAFAPVAFSPDGRSLAYTCRNAAGGTLCITRGRTTLRVPHGGWSPHWSPNGRRIATSVAGNYNSGVAVVDALRGRVAWTRMPTYIGIDEEPLAWSPDSSRLLFQQHCAGYAPCRIESVTRDVRTGKTRRLSLDGLSWFAVRWDAHGVSYVTQPG